MSKYTKPLALIICLLNWVNPMTSQVVSIDIDTIAVHTGVVGGADLTGYTTYRFYAVMANAESKLLDIYGHVEHPLLFGSTGDIWNFESAYSVSVPTSNFLTNFPEAHFDSWFDLENVSIPNNNSWFFDDFEPMENGFSELFMQQTPSSEAIEVLMSDFGSALFNVNPSSSNPDLRIYFAQLTTNGTPQYQLNFHTAVPDCSGEFLSQTLTTEGIIVGCNDPLAFNYDPNDIDVDYSICDLPECLDPEACNYLSNTEACFYHPSTFITYFDMDSDGVLTAGDPVVHDNFSIYYPEINHWSWTNDGYITPMSFQPPIDIIIGPNSTWDVVGSNELTLTASCSPIDILLTNISDPWRIELRGSRLTTPGGINPAYNKVYCSFLHWFDTPIQYNCTLGFDPLLPLLDPNSNEIVTGSSYDFNVNGIFDVENYLIFDFEIPTEDLIGTTIVNTLSCIATDELGVELFSFEDDISRVVRGPYDPNIKIDEPAGWYEPEFIAPDADLTYTIYFQNNGNAPAERVVVVDSLDVNSYDLSTLEILYASDTMSYMLDLTSGVVSFTFDEIYLPDSLSDPEGSIGYFQYRIAPLNNLPHMHEIRNKAYIYFDSNSPIITPSTLQTIFDCASLERESIDLALCPGDSIDVEAFADYIDGVQWSMNDMWLSDSNTLVIDSLPSGDHILNYTFSNPGCEVTNDIHITISPTLIVMPYYTPDGYTTGFDDLYHTWFFNDEEIIGNNSSVFDSNWPDYAHYGLGVIVTDANGCSHSYYEYFIDVNEMEIAKLTWYPNPVSDYLTLHYEGNINDLRKIEILNPLGQVVSTPQIVMSNSSLMIDMHTLPDGMYVLQVNGQALTNSKVIKN
ncbi:MAG: hypothetical protein RLZZ262_286 [Bacteroidota bacterium]